MIDFIPQKTREIYGCQTRFLGCIQVRLRRRGSLQRSPDAIAASEGLIRGSYKGERGREDEAMFPNIADGSTPLVTLVSIYTLCLKKTGHLKYFQISPTKLDQYQ